MTPAAVVCAPQMVLHSATSGHAPVWAYFIISGRSPEDNPNNVPGVLSGNYLCVCHAKVVMSRGERQEGRRVVAPSHREGELIVRDGVTLTKERTKVITLVDVPQGLRTRFPGV